MVAKRFFYVSAGVLCLALTVVTPALAQVELLPMGATYRYLVTPPGANHPPGAEDPGFDDSAFLTGAAPFGFNTPRWISWGLGEGLTVRRHLNLSGSPTGAVLHIGLQGAGSFYINGVLVLQLRNCAGNEWVEQTLPLCDGILHAGDNVFVATCIATGVGIYVGSFFDASITATSGATQTEPTNWGRLKVRYR